MNAAISTLKFTPAALNFGTLYVGQTQFEILTLTNTDGHMITFTNFNIASVPGADSNGFFGVSFCPRTLNPGTELHDHHGLHRRFQRDQAARRYSGGHRQRAAQPADRAAHRDRNQPDRAG